MINKENLTDSLKFKSWRQSIIDNDIQINNIEELQTIRRDNGEVLFSMIKTDLTTPENQKLPPVLVLRGNFVSVLMILYDEEKNREYVLMVKQRRIANGDYLYELPAGMCDSEPDPFNVAIKEVEEETGFIVDRNDLVLMTDEPLYTSPGLLDEAGYFFYIKIPMKIKDILDLDGKNTGCEHENENIKLAVMTIDEALSFTRNMNVIASIYMYLNLENN